MLNKFFNKDQTTDSIDWRNDNCILEAFRKRFVGWYFEPLADLPKTGHEAFPVLLSCCVVVQAASRYFYSRNRSNEENFTFALLEIDPAFRTSGTGSRFYKDIFQCLVYEGKTANNSGITRLGGVVLEFNESPEVMIIDPWIFRDLVWKWFHCYCDRISATPNSNEGGIFFSNVLHDFK